MTGIHSDDFSTDLQETDCNATNGEGCRDDRKSKTTKQNESAHRYITIHTILNPRYM